MKTCAVESSMCNPRCRWDTRNYFIHCRRANADLLIHSPPTTGLSQRSERLAAQFLLLGTRKPAPETALSSRVLRVPGVAAGHIRLGRFRTLGDVFRDHPDQATVLHDRRPGG